MFRILVRAGLWRRGLQWSLREGRPLWSEKLPAMGTTARRLKHWGWGYEDQQPPQEQVEQMAAASREHLGFGAQVVEAPVPIEAVDLPAPRIEVPADLTAICSTEKYDRALHSYGRAYRDVVRAFRGRFDNPPDVVARPRDEQEVERILEWCAASNVAVIPYGGGTSVVGGVEPRVGPGYDGSVSLDLKALDRVLEIDRESRAARIQAGATGPVLEAQLKEHGLTLRHFPQSFEYSTLGGWIVTRAGGHFATMLTHIDDMVESVRAITPVGSLGEPSAAWVRSRPEPRPDARSGPRARSGWSPRPGCVYRTGRSTPPPPP